MAQLFDLVILGAAAVCSFMTALVAQKALLRLMLKAMDRQA